MSGGIVVANPGAIAEIPYLAAGLARANALGLYVAPFATGQDADTAPAFLPGPLRRRAELELRRRRLPADIRPELVHRAGTSIEAAFVGVNRLRFRRGARALRQVRNDRMGRTVAGLLRPSHRAYVGTYGSALPALRRCRDLGVEGVLEWPAIHYGYAEKFLADEAQRTPEYANTLQFSSFTSAARRRFDAELELADRILLLSSFQKRTFVEAGVDEGKIDVVPLGVDLDLFTPRARPDDGVFRVAFSGQIGQTKGLSYLFEGFRLAGIPRSELVLIGRPIGELRLPGDIAVRHVQHVPRWQLPDLYATADVLVFPSLLEGFGQTPLEAMACGVPAIVSEHTFARDVIEDGVDGYVIPVRSPAAIAERLTALAADLDGLARMSNAARKRAEQFSWTAYGDRIASTFDAVPSSEAA